MKKLDDLRNDLNHVYKDMKINRTKETYLDLARKEIEVSTLLFCYILSIWHNLYITNFSFARWRNSTPTCTSILTRRNRIYLPNFLQQLMNPMKRKNFTQTLLKLSALLEPLPVLSLHYCCPFYIMHFNTINLKAPTTTY